MPPKPFNIKGASPQHLDLYKAAGLDYPPCPYDFPPEFRNLCWLLTNAQIETLVYGGSGSKTSHTQLFFSTDVLSGALETLSHLGA